MAIELSGGLETKAADEDNWQLLLFVFVVIVEEEAKLRGGFEGIGSTCDSKLLFISL